MPGDVVAISDYEVMISGEKYSMTEDPKPESAVVTEQIKNTLASIKLEQMCDDLTTLTGDLIYCAYNGIDPRSGELRALVSGSHKSFSDLLLRSEHPDRRGCSRRRDPSRPAKVFRFLIVGKETRDQVPEQRRRKAANSAAGMTKLSEEYKALGVLAQKARSRWRRRSTGWSCSRSTRSSQRLGETSTPENERQSELAGRLATAVKNLQAKYEEAKSKSPSRRRTAPSRSASSARS